MLENRRLLIITQKMDKNDPTLGFFHQWVIEFAKKCEKIIVICLEKGECDLPENVRVFSLGKENGGSKVKYIKNFYKYIWELQRDYDNVFVHMNPEYVVLGGLFWDLWRKKIFLWYTHKSVNLWLRLANNFADKVFTASEKSFRLESDKVVIVGHGIDTEKFSYLAKATQDKQVFRIITAGRISETKNIQLFVEVAEILKNENIDFEIKIAGEPVLGKDKIYFEKIKNLTKEKNLEDKIFFEGEVGYGEIEKFYQQGDLFVNFSNTGSLDKAVLEAMSCGLDVLVSNEAFFKILPGKNIVRDLNPENIANRIKYFIDNVNTDEFNQLRNIVIKQHNIENLIGQIHKHMS